MKNLILILFLLLPFNLVLAQDANKCINPEWKLVNYHDENKGEVAVYIVPSTYNPTVTNLACIAGVEFLSRVNNLPNKATVGLVSEDNRKAYLVKWDIEDNYFLLVEVSIPEVTSAWTGSFIKYKKPLERIKEIITNKPLPKVSSASVVNRFEASIDSIKKLVFEK